MRYISINLLWHFLQMELATSYRVTRYPKSSLMAWTATKCRWLKISTICQGVFLNSSMVPPHLNPRPFPLQYLSSCHFSTQTTQESQLLWSYDENAHLACKWSTVCCRSAQLAKLRNIMSSDIRHTAEKQTSKNAKAASASTPVFADGDDPDDKYVLTMDNAKKILAIHQRLR